MKSLKNNIEQPGLADNEAVLSKKFLLGTEDEPWGEIEPYEPLSGASLKKLPLTKELASNLSLSLQSMPAFTKLASNSSANLYTLTLKPELAQGLVNKSLKFMKSAEGGVHGIVVDSHNTIKGHASLHAAKRLRSPGLALVGWQLVSFVTAQQHLASINTQLEALSRNVQSVKDVLDAKEHGAVLGNLSYLKTMRDSLQHQEAGSPGLEKYNQQLETIERECLQSINSLLSQMDSIANNFAKASLEKNFFFFRNEDKVTELEQLVADFKRQATTCIIALNIRVLTVQTLCALLDDSSHLALARLSAIDEELTRWQQGQFSFYSIVEHRVSEMDGLFADEKVQNKFKGYAADGKSNTNKAYQQLGTAIRRSTEVVKTLNEAASQPLQLVVELDGQAQVKKVSQLNSSTLLVRTDGTNDNLPVLAQIAAVAGIVISTVGDVADTVEDIVNNVADVVNTVGNIVNTAGDIVSTVNDTVNNAGEVVKNVGDTVNNVGNLFSSIFGDKK